MKKKPAIIVLVLLLPVLIASSKYVLYQPKVKVFHSNIPICISYATNYTVGVSPNEEYTWIITAVRQKNLELVFGSNWAEVFGLFGVPQRGYKFKTNITSTQSNGTHYLIDCNEWDCIYRSDNFSIVPNIASRYEYPIEPQNYTRSFEFDALFPFFIPTPPLWYVLASNFTVPYYSAEDYTSYGGGLYVYYRQQVNIGGFAIDLNGVACYLENGALEYVRFDYTNGSELVKCLTIETIEPYHLEQMSMGCQVGEEFTWILVNYNLTVLEEYFGAEFFEKYGLLPNPERMQSIKMKVDGTSENDTDWRVDYSLYNWTDLDDNTPESPIKNNSYAFAKEPFNESRSIDGQIPFLIPQPTELFLRYGRFGDRYTAYYDLYSCVALSFNKGEETLFGIVFYNSAGVLTTMMFSRSVQIGGRTELQVAFEIALCYDSPTPDYVGIKEGERFNYDIYTNETIDPYISFSTKNYETATIEVIKIFGEEKGSGRTPLIANFSLQGNYNLCELKDVFIVGYIHNDSKMYFDPLVISPLSPFYLAPLFVNNKMNWTEFALSYSNYSAIKNMNYYDIGEREDGYEFYYRTYGKNITYSHVYNETGFLSEYAIYYNGQLYHNCSLEGIIPPPIIVDTDPPFITILRPSFEDVLGTSPLQYSLTVEEENLNCTWLTISNGTVEFTQELSFDVDSSIVSISGQIFDGIWYSFSDGNLTLRFWANDSSGNLNWKELSVIKDATAPSVSILNLASEEVFNNTAPEFVLAITEAHLNCTWYVVNGSEIVYFSGTSGTIDQAIWGGLSNGSVLVQFFALDEAGNLGTAEVVIVKLVESKTLPPLDSDEFNVSEITIPFTIILLGVSVYVFIATRKRN